MRTRFSVAAHLSAGEPAARYRAASDPVPRSQLQMVWLLVSGRPLAEAAGVTGYSTRWVREVVQRYNAAGPDGLVARDRLRVEVYTRRGRGWAFEVLTDPAETLRLPALGAELGLAEVYEGASPLPVAGALPTP